METKVTATIDSLFSGMDAYLSSKTVVGNPIHIEDTVIIPLIDISFGVGAGSLSGDKKGSSGGGMGGKMEPSAVIVIHNGSTRLINVSTHSGMDKILDMIPDFVDRFSDKVDDHKESKARDKAAKELKNQIIEASSDESDNTEE